MATHWTRYVADAERCRELAEEAYKRGNMITHQFWSRIQRERADDARKAKKRQEVWAHGK